jgi:hypothetical protein
MRIKPGFQILVLIILALGVYYPTLFAPLNSLDDQVLVHQLLNQDGFSLSRHFTPGGTYDYYRPLLTLTFEIDRTIGGLQESFMHLVNILLHTLNVFLVFLLGRRFGNMIGNSSDLLPFLAAAIFCLHPINTEAVNWIAGRTDVLAGVFVFLSLLCLLHALEHRSLLTGAAGALAMLGGALSKETALFLLPGVFFLLSWRPLQDRPVWPARWALLGFCGGAVAGYFALRWGAFQTDRGISHTANFIAQAVTSPKTSNPTASEHFPLLDAMGVLLKASGFYATKLIQPYPLNFAINRIHWAYLVPGVALAPSLGMMAWRRRPTGVLFLVSAFLGSSALLVVFTRLAWTPIAERYMYIPCGIFSVAVVFAVSPWIERLQLKKAVLVAVPLLLAASAWATVDRNITWQDNLSLYQDTVRKSPDFDPAKNQLALALYSHNRSDEAAALLTTIHISDKKQASLNGAAALARQGLYMEARELLLARIDRHDSMEAPALEMLVKLTTDEAGKLSASDEKRLLYSEIAGWLARLEQLTRNPFHWYRLGRVQLILQDRAGAQKSFAEAARRLPESSIFKEPAAKLARNLAQ